MQTTQKKIPIEQPHYKGIRQRLREPFVISGPDAFQEYALQDLLLFQAIPRHDVKPLEKHFLQKLGSLMEYCQASMAHEIKEHFRILFLNKKNELPADEIQSSDTVDHTPAYPSDDPKDSQEDIETKQAIIEAGRPFNITTHDHVIIARNGHISFKSEGLM